MTTPAIRLTQITRRTMLHSLSVVCQNLRRVFRPCLWQRVEVVTGMWVGEQWLSHPPAGCIQQKGFATELLRQLNVVTIQDPGLAQYVRNVDIEVNSVMIFPVFAELGRCFSLFPNLHTVKILTQSMKREDRAILAAKRGFKKTISYPQIRSAIISPGIYPLIAACPNLESLTTWETPRFLLPAFIKGLTGLRSPLCSFFRFISFAVSTPQLFGEDLRRITIHSELTRHDQYVTRLIKIIQIFPNMRILVLHNSLNLSADWGSKSIKLLKKAFLNLPPHERPNLKEVIFLGRSGEEIFVLPEFLTP